jgi:hypothetical protein
MAAVEVSVVHDPAGRIISVSQFAAGVRAMVLSGEGKSVFMTTVDHALVPELIRTHKIDIERAVWLKSPTIFPALPRTPLMTALPWPRCCFPGKTATESCFEGI